MWYVSIDNNRIFIKFQQYWCFTSQPILRRKPWSSLEIPPITATVRMPSGFPNFMVSSSICWANSRVGAKMTAYGPWSESSILQHKQEVQTQEICINMKKANSLDYLDVKFGTCQFWAGWWSRPVVESGKQPFYRYQFLLRRWCHGSVSQ